MNSGTSIFHLFTALINGADLNLKTDIFEGRIVSVSDTGCLKIENKNGEHKGIHVQGRLNLLLVRIRHWMHINDNTIYSEDPQFRNFSISSISFSRKSVNRLRCHHFQERIQVCRQLQIDFSLAGTDFPLYQEPARNRSTAKHCLHKQLSYQVPSLKD